MNYTSLKNQLQNFLENDSAEFVASIDDIIIQAQHLIFQRLPNLPCFRFKATGTTVVGTSDYLIADARLIRNVFYINNSSETVYLNHRVDSYLRDYWPNSSLTGEPIMYSTIEAGTGGTGITLAPTPNSTYNYGVDYVRPLADLSSSNTTNWLTNNAKNLLLSAALYESSAFLKDENTLKVYKGQFDESVQLAAQEMNRDYASEYDGGI
ncbi:hypothetical protein [Marinobacter sp.]|jgi:hypothetical protein|uniref:phage adaptor protein n=1 Tax=Marinobacter sp. TaxID=50741 RepID=UPI002353D76A|nr:hypothetical protein [Marinobacter sp.]|tara:strand:- start:120 stop:746 length:627 start_codon:yes stop_codon:yes gene_type:complete